MEKRDSHYEKIKVTPPPKEGRILPISMTHDDPQNLREFKALFEAVEKAKYLWESTFDAIVNPVMIIDKNYQIQRANLAFANAMHDDVRNLPGKTCYQKFAGRDDPCVGCPLLSPGSMAQSSISRLERLPDGREYQASSFPLKGKRADLDLFIVQYRDTREENLLQARLLQAEKMAALGTLAGGVAHEINNPLGGILAFAQLALRQVNEGDLLHSDLKEIETSALRCKRIVENLLEFSRQSVSEGREEATLEKMLERVSPLLKLQTKQAGVHLKIDLPDNLPKILANFNQLEQVFLNLTTNACHALTKGGTLEIRVKTDTPGWLQIDFADNGTGIKKEHLYKIFDPFFTTKSQGMGTGLGLSISYNIVQDHGGRLQVESTEGKGTTFKLFLPVVQKYEKSQKSLRNREESILSPM